MTNSLVQLRGLWAVAACLALLFGPPAMAQNGCRFLLDGCGSTPAPSPPSPPPPTAQQYDPVGTARQFYLALARADGSTAAALVVPEKRGRGAYSADSITSFWSTVREPLKILSIERASSDIVAVSYRFVRANGTACQGAARVNTIYLDGKTLIQGISANC